MDEREFFVEKTETLPADIYCPKCRTTLNYQVRWLRRTKKNSLPPRANEEDRARFAKARNYRVRIDDKLRCSNPRCGKTIEISTLQTVVFDQ
jgi:ribosomal protein L44E